jgi:putative hydrolase of the HAD superfamily
MHVRQHARFHRVSVTSCRTMVPSGTLSGFAGVLLDMNGTFMFGGDRFGPDQDYAATYRGLGGRRLEAEVVQGTVTACFNTLEVIYDDPARCDSFPSVFDTLRELPNARDLPETELHLLERVISAHELGHVSDTYAMALRRLTATHTLGVVANILSRKEPWLKEFARAGVLHLFATTVFSSDGRSMKPSRRLFDEGLDALGLPRSEVIFVGDSLRCDIGGAAAAGLATIWINRRSYSRKGDDPQPTFVVRDLLEVLDK